jgi:ribosomal protein S18 acetylase RimI-like enzyme
MSALTIRLAQPEDKAAVLAFCAQTWEWGDYIADVWDQWLTDPGGKLLVAVLDGRPVGLEHLRLLAPGECWLEGMRVDPVVRGQGIAGRLNEYAMQEARKQGATVARLATHAENVVAQRLLERSGFEQIGTFAQYMAPAADVPGAPLPGVAGQKDLPALLAVLDRSNIYPALGGLVYRDWAGRALTEALLQERLLSGNIFVLRQWDDVQALAICGPQIPDEPALLVEYIDGTPEGVGSLAYGLRALAAGRGLEEVVLTLPDLLMLRDGLEGAGYQAEGEGCFLVYERSLETEG